MSVASASGIITLTTDYGLRDPFVGIVQGQILSRFPAARVISLTHSVTPFVPDEAGFWLARSWREFPPGTVHVAVVDPGVGTSRELIALSAAGHLFLAPDNGLLDRVRHGVRIDQCHRLDPERLATFDIRPRSHTFHGRDLLAPVAAELAAGRATLSDLGPATLLGALPKSLPGRREGVIVVVDHFGNLISDLEAGIADGLVEPAVRLGDRLLPLRSTYADVPPGEPVALADSFGLIEVAVNGGSAAEVLRAGRGTGIALVERAGRS